MLRQISQGNKMKPNKKNIANVGDKIMYNKEDLQKVGEIIDLLTDCLDDCLTEILYNQFYGDDEKIKSYLTAVKNLDYLCSSNLKHEIENIEN